MVYTAMFAAGLFSNMKALMLTNVGAVIAARSCLPVIVCIIEWAFMGTIPTRHAIHAVRSPASLASPACTSPTTRSVAVDGASGYVALRVVDPPRVADDLRQVDDGEDQRDDAVGARVLHERLCRSAHDRVVFATGEVAGIWNETLAWTTRRFAGGAAPWEWASPTAVGAPQVITATTFTLVGVLNKMATIAFTVAVCSRTSLRPSVGCVLYPVRAPTRTRRNARTRRRACNKSGVALA